MPDRLVLIVACFGEGVKWLHFVSARMRRHPMTKTARRRRFLLKQCIVRNTPRRRRILLSRQCAMQPHPRPRLVSSLFWRFCPSAAGTADKQLAQMEHTTSRRNVGDTDAGPRRTCTCGISYNCDMGLASCDLPNLRVHGQRYSCPLKMF